MLNEEKCIFLSCTDHKLTTTTTGANPTTFEFTATTPVLQ
jgi:hypothetical protein